MRPWLTIAATLLALLAGGVSIAHASGAAVLNDCTDDERMSKTYSQQDYRAALRELGADADQYGNCRDVIRHAMLAAAGSRKTPTSKGSKTPGANRSPSQNGNGGVIGNAPAEEQLSTATPKERTAVETARNDSAAPFAVGNTTIDPAKVGRVPAAGQVTDLPTPLVVLLALLFAGLLALGAVRIRSLVHARRA